MTTLNYESRVALWAEKRAAVIEEIEFLLSCGESVESMPRRLGCSVDALEKRCYRTGRNDLGVLFARVSSRLRHLKKATT